MNNYTEHPRGSEWRKWDLHFHTPSSYDYKDKSVTNQKIIDTLIANDIAVIAITDHHLMDVARIIDLQRLANGRITILPGIELLSESRGNDPIHFIGIFPENCNIQHIWEQIKNRTNISKIEGERKMINEVYCNLQETSGLIHSLGGLVTIHAGTKTNSIENITNSLPHGIAEKEDISNLVDIFELGKESDVAPYTNIVNKHLAISINKVLPLIICSDNHNINEYNRKQNLWIKADTTFEGLKQITHEPEQRVKIQALKPDFKNERYIISEVQFIDSNNLFGNQKILLNENLNAIIGGKSSGKSLLMFSTAQSIDPEQVDKASKRLEFEGYKFDSKFDFKVTWKNGDVDLYSNTEAKNKLHKITYIPQLYINHLVEKNNKEDLNSLIKNILLQDSTFKDFFEEVTTLISRMTSEIEGLLNEYIKVRNKGLEVRQKSKETGNSDNIKKAIDKFTTEISQGQKASNLTEIEFAEYNKLLDEKSVNDLELRSINMKILTLSKVVIEVKTSKANLLGKTDESNQIYLKGQVNRILDELGELPEDIMVIKNHLVADFDSLLVSLENEIDKLNLSKMKNDLNLKIRQNTEKIAPYIKKIMGQKELPKLISQLESEKVKYQSSIALESQLKKLSEEYKHIRKQTATLLSRRYELYQRIENKVNDTKKNISSDIELTSSLIYKLNNFVLNEQVNKAALNKEHFFNSLHKDGLVNYSLIPEFYEKVLNVVDDKLIYNIEENIPLKVRISLEDVLRGLIKDSFEIDYSVKYNEDNLLTMSPGKKGTVLLILFLQISSAEFPILIDQPEDNLDNRTIYDLLCKMIREKKKDRQIILVSHNANLVVATDTENIIVANQQGLQLEDEGSYRFEYVNGSLEHSFPKNETIKSVLLSQGIKEHVCDILEGGGEAFKQRERKYSIK